MFINYILDKIKYNFLNKLVISIIIWILYLELNPKIGGIWIRPDSNNNNIIRLNNIIPFIIKTLNMKEWEDGRIKAVNLNGPIICNIKSGNWYFIIHPDGTQITCKFT